MYMTEIDKSFAFKVHDEEITLRDWLGQTENDLNLLLH